MTPPPINIDGTDITGATIDGKDVEQITIDGQDVLSAIPDSAVEQFTAESFDDNNDEWVGELGNFNLTGGSATKTTDSNGNTAVEYTGSSGQQHDNTNLTVPYGRVVVLSVFEHNSNSTEVVWSDASNSNVFFMIGDGFGSYAIKWGSSSIFDGSPDNNIHLGESFGPNFNSNDELIIDGSSVVTGNTGSTGLANGFQIGGKPSSDYLTGFVNEVVVYDNPTSSELSNERDRLKNKYSGLSF